MSCLQIDFDKRATPEYLINYEWPLAQDFVEGVEPEADAAYKQISVVRMASVGNPVMNSKPFSTANIEEEKREVKVKPLGSFPEQYQQRDRSPAHRTENRISYVEITDRSKPGVREGLVKPISSHKLMEAFQNNEPSPQAFLPSPPPMPQLSPAETAKITEQCILSQLYYCRFMSNLCDFLDSSVSLPEVSLLKAELISKILGKS